jgi:hypothetical protein
MWVGVCGSNGRMPTKTKDLNLIPSIEEKKSIEHSIAYCMSGTILDAECYSNSEHISPLGTNQFSISVSNLKVYCFTNEQSKTSKKQLE